MILVTSILSITGTPNNGSLPIGNGQGFTVNTLTAGTNITITNGPGTITIAATASGGTPAGNSTEIQYNNAGAFGANSNLKWDITNSRAIIGTEAVANTNSRLVVIGKGQSTNTTFAVHNQLGNNNALVVRDDGRVGVGTNSPSGLFHISSNGVNSVPLWVSTQGVTSNNLLAYFFYQNNGPGGRIGTVGLTIGKTNDNNSIVEMRSTTTVNDYPMLIRTDTNTILYLTTSQSIGINTTSPNASAALDVSSTTKGFLPPRMTTTERNAITTPATGLTIFNTDNNTINQRTSSAWVDLVSSSNYDGLNIAFGTTNGTKIGTATTQKIGFWNATPIVQPTTAVAAATLVSGAGTNIKEDCTFDGYTIGQVIKALRNAGLLA